MKRWNLIGFALLIVASPAKADLIHSISASTQLTVNAAATQATRVGSSFQISGNGVDTTDGTTANTVSVGTITSGAVTQDSPGSSFSFSQTYKQADAVPTSAVTVGAAPNFSDVTSTAAGVPGSLAGTITSPQVLTITAGGAGTTAVGQVVTTLQVN